MLKAFDLDGTLTDSKEAIKPEMAKLLQELIKRDIVVIISGGSFERFKEQLLFAIEPNPNLILLPAEGSQIFEYSDKNESWVKVAKVEFPKKIKEKVLKLLNDLMSNKTLLTKFDIAQNPEGEYIDDRDTEIVFSTLGQKAKLDKKLAWDPDHKKREMIKEFLEERLPEAQISIAGTNTIEILPGGWDKAVGLRNLIGKLNLTEKDIVFVGDSFYLGGNDNSVLLAGFNTIPVRNPEETMEVIKKWLNRPDGDAGLTHNMENPIVYFCTEYALEGNTQDSYMYAGGLGILSGDYLLEIKDKKIPFIAIGLKYSNGDELKNFERTDILLDVMIGEEIVKISVWKREMGSVQIFLLDSDVEGNGDSNRKITRLLYDNEFSTRLKQQIILGIGGVALLRKLRVDATAYHLNEGHTAFAALALLVEGKTVSGKGNKIVATKHTILPEAGLFVKRDDFKAMFHKYFESHNADIDTYFKKGQYDGDPNIFSTTRFLINTSAKLNGVSRLHAECEKKIWPDAKIIPITNGVYGKRWQAKEFAGKTYYEDFRTIKKSLKKKLFDYIKKTQHIALNAEIPTFVWARRFAAYKRPDLIFTDKLRLRKILTDKNHPAQFVISGKAHPNDIADQKIIETIVSFSKDPVLNNRLVYIPDYSFEIADMLVKAADIWLATPERGKEACSTSGMKSSLNGGLQVSVSDGWIDEINLQGLGWTLPELNTAEVLYDLIENEILPCYYSRPEEWLIRAKSTIELVTREYTTERMLNDYLNRMYNVTI